MYSNKITLVHGKRQEINLLPQILYTLFLRLTRVQYVISVFVQLSVSG